MSLLSLPGTLLPGQDTLNGLALNTVNPAPAPAANSSSSGLLDALESSLPAAFGAAGISVPGGSGAAKPTSGWLNGIFGAKGLTFLIGFLLIAAALFTHPTVINVASKAAEGAAAAA